MGRSVVISGVTHTIPTTNDTDWARDFDRWAVAVTERANAGADGTSGVGGLVDANETFSIVPDDADSTAGLLRMRAHARLNPWTTYQFSPGRYNVSTPYWLTGVLAAKILAYGCEFRSIGASNTVTLHINPSWMYFDGIVALGTIANIQTQAAYGSTITFVTAADSAHADYTPGNHVLVYGFMSQVGGYPPNPRYYEYRKITARNTGTGVLTLDSPLRYAYDATWPPGVVAQQDGVARVLSLNRTAAGVAGDVAFSAADHIEICGATFLDCSNGESRPDLTGGYGQLWTHGVIKFVARDCRLGLVFPSENETQLFSDCRVSTMEIDKLIETCKLERCTIDTLQGAQGCNELDLDKTNVLTEFSLGPKVLRVNGGKIHCVATLSTANHASFHDVRFFRRSPSDSWVNPQQGLQTLPACAAATATTITITAAQWVNHLPYLYPGARLFTPALTTNNISPETNYGIVSNVTASGSNVVITAAFAKTPTAGDVFCYRVHRSISVDECYDGDTGQTVTIATPERSERHLTTGQTSVVRHIAVPLPTAIPGSVTVPIDGYITAAEWLVTGAAVHPSGAAYVLVKTSPAIGDVDTRFVGLRRADGLTFGPTGGSALSASDSLAALPLKYYSSLQITLEAQFAATPTTYPRGHILLTVVNHI